MGSSSDRGLSRRLVGSAAVGFCTLLLLVLVGGGAFASTSEPEPVATSAATFQSGKASYYHPSLEGRPTANGEPYRSDQLTAAHRTLPFGTVVQVVNLHNGRSVVVRINDRGPFVSRRVIDLSKAAARELRMVQQGVVRVKLEIVEPAEG